MEKPVLYFLSLIMVRGLFRVCFVVFGENVGV